jgi:putative heme-binding domain-containing protein
LTSLVDYLSKEPDAPVAVKLAGLEVLSAGGALKGDKVEGLILTLLDGDDASVRLPVVRIIEAGKVNKAAPRLAKLLSEGKLQTAERTVIVKALRTLNDKSAVPVLKELFQGKAETPEAVQLRLETFRTLAALDPAAGTEVARSLLDEKDLILQTDAMVYLGSKADGAKLVAERFLAKKLPRELLPQVSDALRKHTAKSPELTNILNEVMKGGLLVSLSKEEVDRVEKLVKTKGSPQRGKTLYLNGKTLACIKCHRLEGVGGSVGPDLTRLWDTHSVEKIMESIIDPSKEIKEGFQTYVATTKKGQVFTGLKISQNADEVVLRDANAQDIRIPAKDLDELAMSKQSLMPDNVIAQLTFDQFIDLVAFLKDRKAQESIRGTALEFWVVGPFPGDPKAVHPPETRPDPTSSYPAAKPGEKLSWQLRQAEPTGMLSFKESFQSDQALGYALTYIYTAKDQKVEMLVGSSDRLKVWLNGTAVHESEKKRPARVDEDKVEVTLKAGWNPVLVKAVGEGFYLRFGGTDLRLATRPDLK